jgi:putative ABC transport system permease protein
MGLSSGDNWSLSVPGYTPRRHERMSVGVTHVTPEYFGVMRIPIVRGRALAASDPGGTSAMSIVVNESFTARYLSGRDPIGAPVALGLARQPNATIVGVARNVVRGFDEVASLSRSAEPAIYRAYAGAPVAGVTLHLRTVGDPLALVPEVRRAAAAVAPTLPLSGAETLAEHSRGAFFLQRLGATVLGGLGSVALLLAALGLYGVTAYSVTERTHEVGVRIALGATAGQVITSFLREGARLTAIGLVVGTLVALAAGRLLGSQLYGVGGRDPLTLTATAVLLVVVALTASYLPARRATRVDPIIALRAD